MRTAYPAIQQTYAPQLTQQSGPPSSGYVARPSMNYPQGMFLAMPHKFKAFVAGYGSGKTWVGCGGLAAHHYEHPRINSGYFGATYAQIRDIFYPTVDEALFTYGLRVEIAEGNKEVHIYQGRRYMGTTICRSMEKPGTIVGFKIGHALVDEIDLLKPQKAMTAWRKIIARMRYNAPGLLNGVDVTTTPEGFGFAYLQFVKEIKKNPELANMYGMLQASTYDNEANLPADYIPSLLASFPPQLIDAYIEGQFVNLRTGTIYGSYDRVRNRSKERVTEADKQLWIGMDFNVGKMAAIVHVLRPMKVMVAGPSGILAPEMKMMPHAVDEIIDAYDTPDMIKILKGRYWKYDNEKGEYVQTRQLRIYPDASGDSRKSVNAQATDLKLLKAAGFHVVVNQANPPVKDRTNSMNAMFLNSLGERRYAVNDDTCPTYADCLEQQAWGENGEPDKTTGHDHPNDAGGYYITKEFGIKKHSAVTEDMY